MWHVINDSGLYYGVWIGSALSRLKLILVALPALSRKLFLFYEKEESQHFVLKCTTNQAKILPD
jgi:hypothetical protein